MSSSSSKKQRLSELRSKYRNGARKSPEPNCPICLERIEDRAFANKCFHDFCRTCLVEWSKVKAECPVCRQGFDRIIYNVKAMDDYDEQYVSPRFSCWQSFDNVHRSLFMGFPMAGHTTTSQSSTHTTTHFRYPSSLNPLRRQVLELQSLIHDFNNVRRLSLVISTPPTASTSISSRMTHSTSIDPIPPVTTSEYRRYIYRHGLWVLPYGNGDKKRYRESSAEFYRRNPACTHRLLPWLNREMVALLDPSADVQGVVDVIMRNIRKFNIASDAFRRVVQPFIANYTDHFIHEFFNFARSYYDCEAYTRISKYVPKERADLDYTRDMVSNRTSSRMQTIPLNLTHDTDSDSSSDSSVIIVDSSSESEDEAPSSSSSSSRTDLSENSLNNTNEAMETETAVSSINVNIGTNDQELSITLIDDFDNPTPGPSGVQVRKLVTTVVDRCNDSETDIDVGGREDNEANFKSRSNDNLAHEEDGADSDSSVEVVEVLKPRHERTPEIIDISESDDEIERKDETRNSNESVEREHERHSRKRHHSRSHRKRKHKKERRRRRSRSRSHSRSRSRNRNQSSDSSINEEHDRYWNLSTHVSLPKIKLSRFHWTSSSSDEESVDWIRKRNESKKYSSDEQTTHFSTPQPRLQKLQSVIISPSGTPSQRPSYSTSEY